MIMCSLRAICALALCEICNVCVLDAACTSPVPRVPYPAGAYGSGQHVRGRRGWVWAGAGAWDRHMNGTIVLWLHMIQ